MAVRTGIGRSVEMIGLGMTIVVRIRDGGDE